MSDKSDLKQAAVDLALEELRGRLLYGRYGGGVGDVSMQQLEDISRHLEVKRREIDILRSNVSEVREKSYWWDIPYDIKRPAGSFPGTYAFGQGIYSEQEDFNEGVGFYLNKEEITLSSSGVLTDYMALSDYVLLYVDRKALKAQLTAPVQIKSILCCEEKLPVSRTIEEYEGEIPVDVENSWDYRRLQAEIKSISGRLAGELQDFDRWHDSAERFLNAASSAEPFTDQERWMLGHIDNDSYYNTEIYRDYRKTEMRQKAQEEISRLEYQMEQMRMKEAKARAEMSRYEMRRARINLDKGITMRMMRCGNVFYLGHRLVGITILNRPEPIYEIKHHGTVSPYAVHGRIGGCREIAKGIPNPAPLIDFILQEYDSRMKPYSVLSARPRGASDEVWRYWAESRFARLMF